MHVADARHRQVVHLHGRRRGHGPRRKPQILQHRSELCCVRFINDDRTGVKFMSTGLELIFGRGHFHVCILKPERNHIVVRRRRHNYHRPIAFNPPWRAHFRGDQSHRLIQQALVRHWE